MAAVLLIVDNNLVTDVTGELPWENKLQMVDRINVRNYNTFKKLCKYVTIVNLLSLMCALFRDIYGPLPTPLTQPIYAQ